MFGEQQKVTANSLAAQVDGVSIKLGLVEVDRLEGKVGGLYRIEDQAGRMILDGWETLL